MEIKELKLRDMIDFGYELLDNTELDVDQVSEQFLSKYPGHSIVLDYCIEEYMK